MWLIPATVTLAFYSGLILKFYWLKLRVWPSQIEGVGRKEKVQLKIGFYIAREQHNQVISNFIHSYKRLETSGWHWDPAFLADTLIALCLGFDFLSERLLQTFLGGRGSCHDQTNYCYLSADS